MAMRFHRVSISTLHQFWRGYGADSLYSCIVAFSDCPEWTFGRVTTLEHHAQCVKGSKVEMLPCPASGWSCAILYLHLEK